MLSFKFTYLRKPSKEYKLKYGLENKARPYFFNHPVGLSGGKYRFNYDRRDRVHIEDRETSIVKWANNIDIYGENTFVKWPRDIDINKEQSFVKWARELDINQGLSFVKWTSILDKNKEYIQELREKNIGKECLESEAFEMKNKGILLEDDYTLETSIKELISNLEYFLEGMTKEVILEKGQIELSRNIKEIVKEAEKGELNAITKALYIENELKDLNSLIYELLKDRHTNTLTTNSKALEKELERSVSRDDPFELEYEVITDMIDKKRSELSKEIDLKGFYFGISRELIKCFEVNLNNTLTKDLEVDKGILGDIDLALYKKAKEILLYKIATLFNNPLDMDIEKIDKPIFKKLNEIYKHKTPVENILFLYTLYDILIDEDLKRLQLKEELINIFKYKLLEKKFEIDLEKEDTSKLLVGNFKYDLFREIQEKLIKIVPNKKLEIEKDFKEIEEVYEIIIHLEDGIKTLSKEYIGDLFIEVDTHRLIKKLIIHELITEKEGERLKKSYVGKIFLEEIFGLDRVAKVREIIAESESLPMVKSFREISINNSDLDLIKEAIKIDINKEREFEKVIKEIEIEGKEERIKFNKRFWFLRATDPFDLKILPFSDYPYSEKPLIFGKSLIPDNWQLDMVHIPRLHEEIKEHPIPWGSNMARAEMELSIEIMIDVINIMILIWSRMFYNFSGYTGSQAVIRFTKILYDWLVLETSLEEMEEKASTEHYFRTYNWIRWEAEKVAIKARDDMSLSGNMYIDEWIFELIYYMENHHFDTMPIFDVIQKMDEYRALLPTDDPQGDISFVLDKVKGMRHKILDGRVKKNNE